MKDNYVTLAVARKLKAAGWKYKTEYVYEKLHNVIQFTRFFKDGLPAPTDAEIFKIFPQDGIEYILSVKNGRVKILGLFLTVDMNNESSYLYSVRNRKLADALALAWIYLKKNGYTE